MTEQELPSEGQEEAQGEATLPPSEPGFPPGVERLPDGQLVRRVQKPVHGGEYREQIRPVATTLKEAQVKHYDWYHPRLGWVREGYKLERDRQPQDIMADGSSGTPDPAMFPTKT